MSENYKFNVNERCEFFPCHKTNNLESFNCLFCYCPLYLLKEECGGNFKYKNGIKDCSDCLIPHSEGGYEFIMSKMNMVITLGRKETE